MLIVRPYRADDLAAIADIHTRVWQQAYVGQVPQDYLDKIDVAIRLQRWRETFDRSERDARLGTLIAQAEGETAGFLSYGPGRDEDKKDHAEIYAAYVLQDRAGRGIGHALFKAACEILRGQDYAKLYLWVLDSNKTALGSYIKWGGAPEPQREKQVEIGGASLKEIAVSFAL